MDSGQQTARQGSKLLCLPPQAEKHAPSAWPICAVRVRIGVCVRMRLMIPSMVSECGPWTGDRGMQPEAGCLRAVSRTRLRRARGGRATPHPGDQLEPPPAGRPEPPIALAPHPAVPFLNARPHARPMGLVAAVVRAKRLPLDQVAELLGVRSAAVEVQVRVVLGTSVIVVVVVVVVVVVIFLS